MKVKTLLFAGFFAASGIGAYAGENIITLDLTKAQTELVFNEDNGAWDKTYSEEDPTLDSQIFCFSHSAMADWDTWWGFTASNSVNNMPQTDYIKYQYSNMAMGGIALNDDGTVKLDEKGAPVVDAKVPYVVAFYSSYMAARPCSLVFSDGNAHEAVGCYINLNSYVYYVTMAGNNFSRPFTNGDKFTLTIHGVAEDETEKTVEVKLAYADNGYYTGSTGWSYVDLSPLGAINELYFTLDSTDTGAYGMNTPGYFCLDKLMVKEAVGTAVENLSNVGSTLSYDRAAGVINASAAGFIGVYNVAGQLVKSAETSSLDIKNLEHGVYVARCGNQSLKLIR